MDPFFQLETVRLFIELEKYLENKIKYIFEFNKLFLYVYLNLFYLYIFII